MPEACRSTLEGVAERSCEDTNQVVVWCGGPRPDVFEYVGCRATTVGQRTKINGTVEPLHASVFVFPTERTTFRSQTSRYKDTLKIYSSSPSPSLESSSLSDRAPRWRALNRLIMPRWVVDI